MKTCIRSPFFLIIFTFFSISFFVSSAFAQNEGAGNWKSGLDGITYTLNYEDKSRQRPRDDAIGQYTMQCDDRQENMTQKTINTSSYYVNGVLSNAENCRNIDF